MSDSKHFIFEFQANPVKANSARAYVIRWQNRGLITKDNKVTGAETFINTINTAYRSC